MQQEFVSTTMQENLTLYVKFKAPQDKAIVVCFFQYKDYTNYKIAYLVDQNSTFNPNTIFQDYQIIKINDNKINKGDDTSFVCSENKTYYITFDVSNEL